MKRLWVPHPSVTELLEDDVELGRIYFIQLDSPVLFLWKSMNYTLVLTYALFSDLDFLIFYPAKYIDHPPIWKSLWIGICENPNPHARLFCARESVENTEAVRSTRVELELRKIGALFFCARVVNILKHANLFARLCSS